MSRLAAPVDMIMGRPFERTWRIRSSSVIDADAILYAGGSNCSRKSTEASSQGDAKQVIPFALQNSSISLYSAAVNSRAYLRSPFVEFWKSDFWSLSTAAGDRTFRSMAF